MSGPSDMTEIAKPIVCQLLAQGTYCIVSTLYTFLNDQLLAVQMNL